MPNRIAALVSAIREGDERMVEDAVLRLSRSRRWLAPLGIAVGGLVMLFEGLRLVFSNWRLTVIQVVPAMWIWLAMYDLRLHALHGRSFDALRGPIVVPLVLGVAAITAGCFLLNAVFAFAIAAPGEPSIRPAFARVRAHRVAVLGSGAVLGLLLGFCTIVVARWGRPWFGLSLSVVVGVMMVCYVAVPSRLLGVKRGGSRRDKIVASGVSTALGAIVCTPPYVLGRVGLLMIGVRTLVIPGVVLFALGLALQAGATGAVKAVKMSATLAVGRSPSAIDEAAGSGRS